MYLSVGDPAKLYKLYPWKGALIPGSDADIVVWNPDTEWTMTAEEQQLHVITALWKDRDPRKSGTGLFKRQAGCGDRQSAGGKSGVYVRHGAE